MERLGRFVVLIGVRLPATLGFAMGLSLVGAIIATPGTNASDWMAPVRNGAIRIGFVTALVGVVALTLLRLHRLLRVSRAPSQLHQLCLAACALWAVPTLGPLIDSASDLIDQLGQAGVWSALTSGDPLSGVALVPALAALFVPALAFGAVVPLAAGRVGALLLARAASPRFAVAAAAAALLATGFLVACFLGLELTGTGLEALGRWVESGGGEGSELLEVGRGHQAVLTSVARSLLGPSLAALGFALLALIATLREQSSRASVPETPELEATAAARGTDLVPRLEHDDGYRIRPRAGLFTSFLRLRSTYDIASGAGGASLHASRDSLAGVIEVTQRPDGHTVLKGYRRAGWPVQRWDVCAAPDEHLLASLRRAGPLGRTWLLFDGTGHEVGCVQPVKMAERVVSYEIQSGGRPVCTCLWYHVPSLLSLRVEFDLDFSRHGNHGFDRRLGIAIGLVLEPHVRFQSHVYGV